MRAVVVGTGLIGTSVALALRERGALVYLDDRDPASLRLAVELGAGSPLPADLSPADIAVLAVPPVAVARVLRDAQKRGLAACYTDVASAKVLPLAQAEELGCDLQSYVAGHPMAGRERSGPAAARADLFLGKPWALCPTDATAPQAVAAVIEMARLCGAEPVVLPAAEHDQAVALISHAPHVASSAMAARLAGASERAVGLAGQGVRDVTRIAAGDPELWSEILAANAQPIADVLEELARDLATVAVGLRMLAGGDKHASAIITDLLGRGNAGVARIPGKHGGRPREYAVVPVVIPDEPGALARLFAAAGEAGVNIEDVSLEHSPGLPVAVAELSVKPAEASVLAGALAEHGWSVHHT